MRKRIFEIIDIPEENDHLSRIYDIFILSVIIISIIPLCFKRSNIIFYIIDFVTCIIFLVDYVFRLITADYKLRLGKSSFFIYPFTPFMIIDFISIIPIITLFNNSFALFRLIRIFKTFRLFKSLRYSKNFDIIIRAIKKEREILTSILLIALGYTLISSLIMFNVEPGNFNNFFDAFYWATSALTTVGYGDIYPITQAGKIVSIVSSFFGIAIIALPSGIITASFISEVMDKKN
ncbi:ion transporter [Anaerofustis sp.]|uniref:potassium channel family protein n=1 Tax=Anaerofustis sp. TaxID=1872517 RepID=UPI0025BC7E16|nr:ion transporter [Anaerofustis sp.]